MKTSELIQFVAKDMLDDRKNLISGESDVLFTDSLIARYLAEAERILCRRAWVLEDNGAVCGTKASRIQLVAGKGEYPVDKSVLFVKAVRLSDSDLDLVRVGYNGNRVSSAIKDSEPWDVNYAYVENPGRPSRYSTDMGTRVIRLRQKPDAASALLKLHLSVVRMPLAPISAENGTGSPEIPEDYQMDLTLYAAGKCLNRPTVEAELRTLGRQWIKEFDERVAEARRDRIRFTQSEPQHHFGAWAGGDA